MSQEKTEKATAKQRERFADEGEVVSSRDLNAVVGLATAVLTLLAAWNAFSRSMISMTQRTLGSLDVREISSHLSDGLRSYGFIVLSVGGAVAVAGGLAGLSQTGGRIFWKSLKIDITRLNPLPKFVSMFASTEALINLGLNVVKVTLMAAACGSVLYWTVPGLVRTVGTTTGGALMVRTLLPLVGTGIFAFVLIAIADYIVSYFRLEKKMRMSAQEVKDDRKETDGDPKVKQRQRQKALDFVRSRSVKAVPTSDVIIVNPTHYSVAIKYDRDKMAAPRVVAKGVDRMALRIREIADEHGVPIVREPPLARFLYGKVKVGRSVPAEAFQAVARVLAYVYQLRRGNRR